MDRALRYARKMTPAAIQYAGRVMRDEDADPKHRIKAAEIILLHGMPKGDAHRRHLEAIEGGVNSLRVEFVAADGSVVSFEHADLTAPRVALPAIIEVPFDQADNSVGGLDGGKVQSSDTEPQQTRGS